MECGALLHLRASDARRQKKREETVMRWQTTRISAPFGARKLIVAAQHVCLYKRTTINIRQNTHTHSATVFQSMHIDFCASSSLILFSFGVIRLPAVLYAFPLSLSLSSSIAIGRWKEHICDICSLNGLLQNAVFNDLFSMRTWVSVCMRREMETLL